MSFNYQARYRKFRNEERRFALEAFREGMKREDILEIIKFDWEVFKSERVFCTHNQRTPEFGEADENTETNNPLQQKFTQAMSSEDRYLEETMEDIILSVGDEDLYRTIAGLNEEQKNLLYEIAILRNKPSEVARDLGVSRAAITKRMKVIKKIIKKV